MFKNLLTLVVASVCNANVEYKVVVPSSETAVHTLDLPTSDEVKQVVRNRFYTRINYEAGLPVLSLVLGAAAQHKNLNLKQGLGLHAIALAIPAAVIAGKSVYNTQGSKKERAKAIFTKANAKKLGKSVAGQTVGAVGYEFYRNFNRPAKLLSKDLGTSVKVAAKDVYNFFARKGLVVSKAATVPVVVVAETVPAQS